MKRKTIFITVLVGLLLAFVGGTLLYTVQKPNQPVQMSDLQREVLVRTHSPSLGKADAPVVIVEFFDPACETCRMFYPLVKEMMAANPGQIRLVLRYTPFHDGSDQVVAILEAAHRQGKFWPALEALLATQENWVQHHKPQVALVWNHLEGLGLNLEQMRADMVAPETVSVIAQDIADARTLTVTRTPEFFVNGKPLPTFGYEQLKWLVDDALNSARR